jgi:glucose-6-phosphate isomerase
LNKTLCIVISKSGGTKETRNGMLVAEDAFRRAGLDFGQHAVAITTQGSELDKRAVANKWITRFPMWDWVGGRTSELSAVGLLPTALQGIDITYLLSGACECDKTTRINNVKVNPASLLSLSLYASGNGKGTKNMVVLPYKDRLELFSKYLQQLIMESLGKEHDLDGNVVNQGIVVLGNKGATDQHSYVQQLRDGLNNFFAIFIEVLKDGDGKTLMVDPGVSSGDYLHGFYLGTRGALAEKGRELITITVNEVSPFVIGVLIALFERAVGFYASLVNINAYNQPGVEAGKKAAGQVIQIQSRILEFLAKQSGKTFTVEEIANGIERGEESEHIFKVCEHLLSNQRIKSYKSFDNSILSRQYGIN